MYYASSCATGRISRLLLADVSGHGNAVAATAAGLRTLMRRFVNRLDRTEFVRLLNQQFIALSQDGTFATAIVTTFFAPSRRLTVCNTGHPRPLMYRAKQGGVISYTDALIESRDADGEMLGEAGLLRIMRFLGDVDPHRLIDTLLKEIAERYPENLSDDDVTVLVVRANGREPRHSLREQFRALIHPLTDSSDQSPRRASAVAGRESSEYRRHVHSRARAALARGRQRETSVNGPTVAKNRKPAGRSFLRAEPPPSATRPSSRLVNRP